MTLDNFIAELQTISDMGCHADKFGGKSYGDLQVFYRHGSSGDCEKLSSPYITDSVDENGPFDITEGEYYVAVYVGN